MHRTKQMENKRRRQAWQSIMGYDLFGPPCIMRWWPSHCGWGRSVRMWHTPSGPGSLQKQSTWHTWQIWLHPRTETPVGISGRPLWKWINLSLIAFDVYTIPLQLSICLRVPSGGWLQYNPTACRTLRKHFTKLLEQVVAIDCTHYIKCSVVRNWPVVLLRLSLLKDKISSQATLFLHAKPTGWSISSRTWVGLT